MKNLHITVFFISLFLICACQDGTDNASINDKSQTQVHFTLDVCSGLQNDASQTRAVETSNAAKSFNDKDINDLWVIQCSSSMVKVAKYFSKIQSSDIISALTIGDSEIWFIANTGNSSLFSDVTTLEDLKSRTLDLNTSDPEESLAVNGYLRAVGCWRGEILENGKNYISVSLVPLAAKLTIDYEIIGAGENYGFDDILLTNVPKYMHYCTTTDGTSTKDYVTTAYTAFTPDTDNKQKGHLVYYVTESIPGISGITNNDPRKKSQYGENTNAMFLSLHGNFSFNDRIIPFNVSLYPGGNTTNDFNIKINHNYHIYLSIDVSKGPNNWEEDYRINIDDIKIPTDGLQVKYEFSNDDRAGHNSLYDADGISLLPNEGKYLRNLVDGSYSTERLTYSKDESRLPIQTFTEGTNYMSYSNCSINTGYGSELTSSSAFTIIYVGGCGKSNSQGWSVYGPTNYGDPEHDHLGEVDGRRWYLVVNNRGEFQYGCRNIQVMTIPNFVYTFDKDSPYIIFSADKNTPNSTPNTGGTRDILLDNITAKTLNTEHYEFSSNFYLGCNKWEGGWVTQEGKVYLFLIYNRTLSVEEINQIRIYSLYKGFLKRSL